MTDSQNTRWRTLLIEGPAIVISILLAFAIDAWWDERQTEQDIIEDLAIVEHELEENIRLVQLAVDQMEQIVSAKDRLVEQLLANIGATTIEVAVTDLYWAMYVHPTLDPSLGGTDAWIAAGQLGVIESLDLRQRLAGVRGKFEDTIEEQRDARNMAILQIYPAIQDGSDISAVRGIFAGGWQARQATEIQEIPDFGAIDLPVSNALISSLQVRALWYQASIVESLDLLAELEEIRTLVRTEMERY